MRASKIQPSCDSVKLDVLLYGDEDSDEFRGCADHVESCPRCQDRLSNLAADDGAWAEVRDVLQTDDVDMTAEASAKGSSPQRLKLDFLAPPSHPEMLGRLGSYEIENVIGSGGMGIVLKAYDTELNRPAAIKVLAPHLAHSGAARQRFAREARAAAAVVHEHVVAIHDVESEHEVPFLVMQYIPGWSLQERVDREGPLSAEEILRIGMQAAAGLAAAHAQGVIHRDVKPANILLEKGVERTMLTDFGLARAADDASLTHSGIVAGTPHYMSPEQARGDPADFRSDLFSLGSVLYFMATGHPPFRAERAMAVLHRICNHRHRPVREINPAIPEELEDLIDRLLEKKPSRRFASAGEAQQALAGVLSHVQQPRPWRARRWLRRRRWQVSGAVLAGLAAATIWSFPTWYGPAENSPKEGPSTEHRLEVRADQLRTQQIEFTTELRALDQALERIRTTPYPESVLLRSSGDSWMANLRAADAEVTRLEKSWSVGPSVSLNSLKGENR